MHKSLDDSRLHKSMDDSSIQLSTKKDNGGEARSKSLLTEEMAESTSLPVETVAIVPSLLGPYPTWVDKPLCPDNSNSNRNSMQMVPFTRSNRFEQVIRGSRTVDYSTTKGNGQIISYMDALMRNVVLPKQHISPLKVNHYLSLISNYVPHDPQNSLSVVSHNQQVTPNSFNDSDQVYISPTKSKKNTNLDGKPKRK